MSEGVRRRDEDRQVQEADLHGSPSLLWGEGIREVCGSRPRAGGSEGSVWGVSTMAWALLLVTLLTQDTGEASREWAPGTSG